MTTRAVQGVAFAAMTLIAACSRQVQVGSPPAGTPLPAATVAPIATGQALVEAMQARYAGRWYRNLTFVQRTTINLPNGQQLRQTWYEAGEMPGRLRIDIDTIGRNGVLFANDSVYQYSGGRLVRGDTGVNDLMVLGFDVYAQPAARSLEVLRRRGFDLSKFHEAAWEGRPVYVVGALAGDTVSKQFWVDRERLLFVRLIEQRGAQRRDDIRFEKYVPHGGGWVAEEVRIFVNGSLRMLEQYDDVRVNVALPEGLFDPRRFGPTPHWYRAP